MTTLLLLIRGKPQSFNPAGAPRNVPDRIRPLNRLLGESPLWNKLSLSMSRGTLDLVTLCHNEQYCRELRHIAPASGLIYLDGDTRCPRAPGKR